MRPALTSNRRLGFGFHRMSTSKRILFSFVLENLDRESLERQSEILRALADYAGDSNESSTLLQMASSLDNVRKDSSQLRLALAFSNGRPR